MEQLIQRTTKDIIQRDSVPRLSAADSTTYCLLHEGVPHPALSVPERVHYKFLTVAEPALPFSIRFDENALKANEVAHNKAFQNKIWSLYQLKKTR